MTPRLFVFAAIFAALLAAGPAGAQTLFNGANGWEYGPNCWWPNPNSCPNTFPEHKWNGAQCENFGTANRDNATFNRGRITVQTAVKAKGLYAAEFLLQAGRTQSTQNSAACEALKSRPIGAWPRDDWFAISVRVPTNFVGAGRPVSIVQYGFMGVNGSPAHLTMASSTNNYTNMPGPNLRVTAHGGECYPAGDSRGCAWSNANNFGVTPGTNGMVMIPPAEFVNGAWYDIVLRIRWTYCAAGGSSCPAQYEGWSRRRGVGAALMQRFNWTAPGPSLQNAIGTSAPNAADTVNDKIGAYTSIVSTTQAFVLDNFCRATSKAAAEACL